MWAESTILVRGVPVPDASPMRLWRKNNQAAVLDFRVPRRTYLSLVGEDEHFRQGSTVELFFGAGAATQRIFYGYLPSEGMERAVDPSERIVSLTATDFVGQLQSHVLTLGDSASSFIDPAGREIGGLIATLVQRVIDHQDGTTEFSANGVKGTDPQQFITPADAIHGTKSAKAFLDDYTRFAFDDTTYPEAPLRYEYHQRDQHFVWRKQKALTDHPARILTLGRDAVLRGTVRKQPVYTDAIATGTSPEARWHHADRDSRRRWGGKRFFLSTTTSSSFLSDAYAESVRSVELQKSERMSFSIAAAGDAFLLYPGDVVRVYGGIDARIPERARVEEISISMVPSPQAIITVGVAETRLTQFL